MHMTPTSPAQASDLPTRGRRWLIAVGALAVFLIADGVGLGPFRMLAGEWSGWPRIAALAVVGYGLYLVLPFALAAALFGPRAAPGALGLDRSLLAGFGVGLLATAPQLIGMALAFPFAPPADPLLEAFRGSILPGIAEEVLYRALLFGFLFRYTGWGFLPAALVGAVFFGAAHLYQGETPMDALFVALITGLGAVWFAWLYVEWRFNLWVPIAFHILMNLYWELFSVDDSALGGPMANVLRASTLVAAVVVTLIAARRRGGRLVRGRAWLWGGPKDV